MAVTTHHLSDAALCDSALCNSLTQSGLLSRDQVQISQLESKKSGQPLDKCLVRLGFVTETVLKNEEQKISGHRTVSLASVLLDTDAIALVSVEMARRFLLVPVSLRGEKLVVATTDAFNLPAIDRLSAEIGGSIKIEWVLAGEREILEAIDRFYGFELSIDGIFREIEADKTPQIIDTDDYRQPVVRLVDAILADAVKRGASDIHFEPEESYVRLRYRIDGVLRQIRSFHIDYWAAIVVRVKVMSELNIAEHRAPQDGNLSLSVSGSLIEFRVALMPTIHGENMVLRVLDKQKGIVKIDSLGLADHACEELLRSMNRPEGLILVTGPTGSGKTTTLYSMLAHRCDEKINIMTLEDPVEYSMSLLRQTSVNEQVKLDFGTGIKAILRQDPDVILVGEIRDDSAAEMVFRASMTGHQVFSTLHANNAIGALARLKDLGISAETLGNNLIAIVAQRLVRVLCCKCRVPVALEIAGEQVDCYDAGACAGCEWQGYSGRVAVMEVLRFNPELGAQVAANGSVEDLMLSARRGGFSTLTDAGLRLVREGTTSMAEVSRVIDFTNIPE